MNIGKVMDATGGELFDVQNMASLDAVFSALIQRIKTRYTLGYYTMANGAEGSRTSWTFVSPLRSEKKAAITPSWRKTVTTFIRVARASACGF